MEVMNCSRCKRLFNWVTGEKICANCKKELEEKFQEVKQFIKDNPGNNINQVSEACEVPVKQIKKWVREERLTFTDDSLVGLTCERCGAMIHSGKFCAQCAGSLENSLNGLYRAAHEAPKKTGGGKMRFLE